MDLRRIILVVSLILGVSPLALAQGSWSDWGSTGGGGTSIEYRWRLKLCQPVGCFKEVEFRNNTKSTILFDYTIWSEGLPDKGAEVKEIGIASVSPDRTASVQAGSGGEKINRITINLKK
jgi:hypothetical protein